MAAFELRLQELREQLSAGTYRPMALRQVTRNDRVLEVPTIADCIVSRVLLDRLRPVEAALPASVVGFRRGNSQVRAVARIAQARVVRPWVLRADIKAAFPSVLVRAALQALAARTADTEVLLATAAMLEAVRPDGQGLPVGHPLSPLLLNVYLADVDLAVALGLEVFRYADDIVILGATRKHVDAGHRELAVQLDKLGMRLCEGTKAPTVHGPDESFDFLGWEVRHDGFCCVSQASVDALIDTVCRLPRRAALQRIEGWLSHYGQPMVPRLRTVHSCRKLIDALHRDSHRRSAS